MNVAPHIRLPSRNAVMFAARPWAASIPSAMCCASITSRRCRPSVSPPTTRTGSGRASRFRRCSLGPGATTSLMSRPASPGDADGPILSLAYAGGTTISRLNKGDGAVRTRAFSALLLTRDGRWTGSKQEGDDDEPDRPAQATCRPDCPGQQERLAAPVAWIAAVGNRNGHLQHALARVSKLCSNSKRVKS